MIRTPLHNILPSLRIPIVSGPMGGAAGGKLAAEVSRAGGFGFIGGGYLTPSQLDQEFEVVDSILGGPTGPSRRMEIGVGFLGWKLSQLDSSPTATSSNSDFDPASRPKAFACIDATLKKLPRAIWLAFGTSSDLSEWAKAFRERERALHGDRIEDSWKLFVGVGSEQEAKVAVEEVGADVVVAQGMDIYVFLALIVTDGSVTNLLDRRYRSRRPWEWFLPTTLDLATTHRPSIIVISSSEPRHRTDPARCGRPVQWRTPRLLLVSRSLRSRIRHSVPVDTRELLP
jgi:hypothetical protein